MDYARNNFVAQPGDYERGVRLTPPILGVYDIYAINWGYRLVPDAKTPKDEIPTLDKWIEEKKDDPMYTFGAKTRQRSDRRFGKRSFPRRRNGGFQPQNHYEKFRKMAVRRG